jgi:hypothetical protein
VRPVRGSEGVVHVHVAQLGHLPGQVDVVLLLAGQEARVLQQQHAAILQPVRRRLGLGPHGLLHEAHLTPQQLAQPRGARPQRHLGDDFPLGPPEVREQHDARARVHQVAEGGHGGADARVVGDLAGGVERNVVVHAHQHAPATERVGRQVVQRELVHRLRLWGDERRFG